MASNTPPQPGPSEFDSKAAEYDRNPVIRGLCSAAAQALAAEVLRPGDAVLDFGCGTGLLAQGIAGACSAVVGVDTSQGMIQAFRQKAAAATPGGGARLWGLCVYLLQPGALHAANDPGDPFPERFDAAVSSMTLHHLPDIPAVFAALVALLKPGGRLAVLDLAKSEQSDRFHRAGGHHSVYHRGGFTLDQLCSYLQGAGLEGVVCREVHRFLKLAGDNPEVEVEHGLLLAVGVLPAEGE